MHLHLILPFCGSTDRLPTDAVTTRYRLIRDDYWPQINVRGRHDIS
jgi:hypothetical protein